MPSASSDLRRRKYKHFFVDEIPDRYEARVDVRRFSSGERIVFALQCGDLCRDAGMIRERRIITAQTPAVDHAIAGRS
jgi:hypothetical protein